MNSGIFKRAKNIKVQLMTSNKK